ncbi:hypothetical protein DHC50_11840 [Arenibacter sp. A80]|nr:hypothetical protein [Arenibacter sp. A80]RFT56072.1 hypothetical protein D0S24_11840 [Arenibacter sp. P308M17]
MERCCEIESWVASFTIIPGLALADIYEQYGARILEQNVRSFLQFTGKINKGFVTLCAYLSVRQARASTPFPRSCHNQFSLKTKSILRY